MSHEEHHVEGRGFKRHLVGRVVNDTTKAGRMQKTVVVEVVRFKRDTMYKKYVRVRKKYKAHDETNQYKVGDRVEIEEHRPMSAEKRFIVTRLIARPASELG